MTKSSTRDGAAILPAHSQSLRHKLMFAASAGILAMVAPGGLYGTRAQAQVSVPAGCDDEVSSDPNITNNGNGEIEDGETIECDRRGQFDRIETNVADLTINIGRRSPSRAITLAGNRRISGQGQHSWAIRKPMPLCPRRPARSLWALRCMLVIMPPSQAT